MKQAMAAVCVAAGCGVLFAADFFPNPEDGWQVMPVRVVQDATDVLPESGAWKPGRFAGAVPQAEGAKKGDAYTAEYNCWYKRAFDIPADWKGKDVRLQLNLNALDAVVHVNGKKAGVLHHMQEDLEISGMLACGQPNEIKIFVTNGGFGIGEKPNAYHGRDDGHVEYGHLGVKFNRVNEPPIRLAARPAPARGPRRRMRTHPGASANSSSPRPSIRSTPARRSSRSRSARTPACGTACRRTARSRRPRP